MVALSTTEAEFMALTEATKEALWLQGLLGELGVKQGTVTIQSDSQSTIPLSGQNIWMFVFISSGRL